MFPVKSGVCTNNPGINTVSGDQRCNNDVIGYAFYIQQPKRFVICYDLCNNYSSQVTSVLLITTTSLFNKSVFSAGT